MKIVRKILNKFEIIKIELINSYNKDFLNKFL